MDRRIRNAVLQCTGAIVGAGFASGREIMRFFSRYGSFSWIGVFLAAVVMGVFAFAIMKKAREADAQSLSELCRAYLGPAGVVGTIAFTVLIGATGGSMSAAAGEIGALALPVHGAYWIAFLCTLLLCLVLSRKSMTPLAYVSLLLVPVMVIVFLLCLIPPQGVAATPQMILPVWRKIVEVVLFAVSYGALNITLAAGVLCEIGRGMNDKRALLTSAYLGLCLLALLALGNIALVRQPQLADAALPIVMLLNRFGKMGFWVSVTGLYLAVFTTLLAAARSFFNILGYCKPVWLSFALTGVLFFLFGVVGFAKLVGIVYPVLGILCLLLLLWMLTGRKKAV
jgi:uncharacterized membrane protein YkvI